VRSGMPLLKALRTTVDSSRSAPEAPRSHLRELSALVGEVLCAIWSASPTPADSSPSAPEVPKSSLRSSMTGYPGGRRVPRKVPLGTLGAGGCPERFPWVPGTLGAEGCPERFPLGALRRHAC